MVRLCGLSAHEAIAMAVRNVDNKHKKIFLARIVSACYSVIVSALASHMHISRISGRTCCCSCTRPVACAVRLDFA